MCFIYLCKEAIAHGLHNLTMQPLLPEIKSDGLFLIPYNYEIMEKEVLMVACDNLDDTELDVIAELELERKMYENIEKLFDACWESCKSMPS